MATVDVEQWLEGWLESHPVTNGVDAQAYRVAKDNRENPGQFRPGTPAFEAYMAVRHLTGQLIADSLSDGISTRELCQALGSEDIEGYLAYRQIARSA